MSTMVLAASMLPIAATPVVSTPLEALDSVFVVTTADSQGAGFIVSDRLMVTAAHVVEGSTRVRLEGTQDPPVTLEVDVVYRDAAKDVAILAIDGMFDQSPLDLRTDSIAVGEEVFAAGSPIDGVVLSKGRVSETSSDEGIVSSTPVDPGNSGGPLLDGSGTVVGMVYAQSLLEGSAYSVPVDVIQGVIEIADAQLSPGDNTEELEPVESVSTSLPLITIASLILLAATILASGAVAFVVKTRRQSRQQAPPITITLEDLR